MSYGDKDLSHTIVDTFLTTPVRASKMDAVARALLTFQMLTLLQKYIIFFILFDVVVVFWENTYLCKSSKLYIYVADKTHCGLVMPYGDKDLKSTMPQVMACCLAVPSHYLSQCWLIHVIISEVLWHSCEGYFVGNAQDIYPWYEFENY